MQDTTRMQFLMLQAHQINRFDESNIPEKSAKVSQEQADKLWEAKMQAAEERISSRKKSREDILKEATEKLTKQIE